jgi:co-chaperonin GroES (HSP10)
MTENPSGVFPTEFKVLIAPSEVGDKIGNIFIPDEHKERAQFAQMEGVLVALAPLAFTYADWAGVEDKKPKPGDRVLFAKFAGFAHKGKDGKTYRVVNDKDVSAVLG